MEVRNRLVPGRLLAGMWTTLLYRHFRRWHAVRSLLVNRFSLYLEGESPCYRQAPKIVRLCQRFTKKLGSVINGGIRHRFEGQEQRKTDSRFRSCPRTYVAAVLRRLSSMSRSSEENEAHGGMPQACPGKWSRRIRRLDRHSRPGLLLGCAVDT